MESILEMRAFRQAYDDVERAKENKDFDLEQTYLTDLVDQFASAEITEWASQRKRDKEVS